MQVIRFYSISLNNTVATWSGYKEIVLMDLFLLIKFCKLLFPSVSLRLPSHSVHFQWFSVIAFFSLSSGFIGFWVNIRSWDSAMLETEKKKKKRKNIVSASCFGE